MPTVTALITGTELQVDDTALKTRFLGSVRETLDIVLKFIMAFGVCFQLPVLLTLMGKAGLVSSVGLRAVRKYAIVAILILAGIVTPPDVVTQVILFVVCLWPLRDFNLVGSLCRNKTERFPQRTGCVGRRFIR